MRQASVGRKVGIASALVFAGAVVTVLVLLLAEGGLDQGDKIASIASMVIAGISLPITVYTAYLSIRRERHPSVSSADRLDAVADVLADAVRAQWEAEEQIRHVHDPFPLPFRWRGAEDDITDHWQNIRRDPADGSPLALHGQGENVVDLFFRIPSGRLVVLGEAGAGKTILASRFVVTLLDERGRNPDLPVPVIFSLGSWDPTRASLREWLVEQLIASYPVLAQLDDSGETLAARLHGTRRVLPVLDGLDEVTEGFRGGVIRRINEGMRRDDRLLLTSRPGEFREAVEAVDVLTAAAVVRLEKLTVDDLDHYLPLTTRRTRGSRTKWDPVLAHVREAGADDPLSQVLSTPLMVAIARAMYSDTDADPVALLDGATTRDAVERRLLAGFVPAAYSVTDPGPVAERLRFLARHLHRLRTHDIEWWRFVHAVPRPVIGTIAGLVITLAGFLGGGFCWWVGHWPDEGAQRAWLVATLVASTLCGICGGVIVGHGRGIRPAPARVQLRVRGRLDSILREFAISLRGWRTAVWLGVFVVAGVLFGAVAVAFGRDGSALVAGLGAGVFTGCGLWFVASLVNVLSVPIEPTRITTPVEVLRTDRSTGLRQGMLVGVGGSVVFWLMLFFAFEPAFGMPFEVVFGGGRWLLGFLVATVIGPLVWMLLVTAWGPWLIARSWLSLAGRLPWTVMAFLAEAHRRGVVRQAGGVYQFRHARLRDYFAA